MPTTKDFIAGFSANGYSVIWGVPFTELCQYYRASAAHLKSRGIAGKDLAREIRNSFRAMCPRCNYGITATTIASLSITMAEGRENVHFTQQGPMCRMMDGNCPRGDCPQKDAVVIWGGHPNIIDGVQTSLVAYWRAGPQRKHLGGIDPRCCGVRSGQRFPVAGMSDMANFGWRRWR